MNKKGFTLTELLVVIALIGVLALLVVPNVMKVRNNINERLYSEKLDYILSAAELYAGNNPDIFSYGDSTTVSVAQLIDAGYLKADGSGVECDKYYKEPDPESTATEGTIEVIGSSFKISKGCVLDPRFGTSLNNMIVTVTKKNVGIVAEFNKEASTATTDTLVTQVCKGFDAGNFIGKTSTEEFCTCLQDTNNPDKYFLVKADYNKGDNKVVPKSGGARVNQCVLVSNKDNGDIDNWVKYGSTTANWRVVGLYSFDNGKDPVAKIITSSIVQ